MDGGGGEERRKGFEYSWQVCDWASQSLNTRLLSPVPNNATNMLGSLLK